MPLLIAVLVVIIISIFILIGTIAAALIAAIIAWLIIAGIIHEISGDETAAGVSATVIIVIFTVVMLGYLDKNYTMTAGYGLQKKQPSPLSKPEPPKPHLWRPQPPSTYHYQYVVIDSNGRRELVTEPSGGSITRAPTTRSSAPIPLSSCVDLMQDDWHVTVSDNRSRSVSFTVDLKRKFAHGTDFLLSCTVKNLAPHFDEDETSYLSREERFLLSVGNGPHTLRFPSMFRHEFWDSKPNLCNREHKLELRCTASEITGATCTARGFVQPFTLDAKRKL